MNEVTEQIKTRIKKLLALSKSDNENEAASALEKANELIKEYGIDEGAVRFNSVSAKGMKTYRRWRVLLGNAVAWLYSCHRYTSSETGNYIFTGEPLYAFMAAEMFLYLSKTIERIAKKEIRKNAKLKFRDSFKYGLATRLYERIYEMGDKCSWAPQRENVIADAEKYIKNLILLETPKAKQAAVNKTAYSRGRVSANSVSLARQAGHSPAQLPSPRPRLKQGELFNDL